MLRSSLLQRSKKNIDFGRELSDKPNVRRDRTGASRAAIAGFQF